MTRPRFAVVVLLVAFTLCLAERADASELVLVVAPEGAEGGLRETITRTVGELRAAGFRVERRVGGSLEALEAETEEAQAFAAVAVRPGPPPEVWVVDRLTGKRLQRRVTYDDVAPSERPRALAIRAVELLRASLVEATAPSTRGGVDAPVPAAAERLVAPLRSIYAGWTIGAGAALMTGFDGIGPAGSPAFHVGWATDWGLGPRLRFVGPAFGPSPSAVMGEAVVRQELILAELSWSPDLDAAGFAPATRLGVGAHHLAAQGEVAPPLQGRSVDAWSLALTTGVGFGYRLHRSVALTLDADVIWTVPRPVVQVAGERLGTTGRPALTGTFGVVVRLDD